MGWARPGAKSKPSIYDPVAIAHPLLPVSITQQSLPSCHWAAAITQEALPGSRHKAAINHCCYQPLCTEGREGDGTPLQCSCLENPMGRGAWWAAVHGVAKSRTRLSDFTFTFHFHTLEKEMATHSSVLAWRIPGTGEPGGLPSQGSHRVGHN